MPALVAAPGSLAASSAAVQAFRLRRGDVCDQDLHRVVNVLLCQAIGLQAILQLIPHPGLVELAGELLLKELRRALCGRRSVGVPPRSWDDGSVTGRP